MTAKLQVLGRQWCHLCDDMVDMLMAMAVSADVSIVFEDVDEDEALVALWDERVPVLLDDEGRELCHYRLDIPAVSAYLSRFPIKSSD